MMNHLEAPGQHNFELSFFAPVSQVFGDQATLASVAAAVSGYMGFAAHPDIQFEVFAAHPIGAGGLALDSYGYAGHMTTTGWEGGTPSVKVLEVGIQVFEPAFLSRVLGKLRRREPQAMVSVWAAGAQRLNGGDPLPVSGNAPSPDAPEADFVGSRR